MESKTVEAVETKQTSTGKPFYLVTFTDGIKASIWDQDKHRAQILTKFIGDEIELTVTQSGDYYNIGPIKDEAELAKEIEGVIIPTAAPKSGGGGFGGGKADPKKIVSIERQATAKMVMNYYGLRGIEINQELFKKTADFVYGWIHED